MIPYTNLSMQQLLEVYVAYLVLSAAVQSLSVPTTESSEIYTFIYKFCNLLIADFKSYAQKIVPPVVQTSTTTTDTTTGTSTKTAGTSTQTTGVKSPED